MFIVHLTQSLVVLLALIGAAFWLKRRGIVDADNAQGFTRIVTELLLPALVFASLSRHALRPELMLPGLVMLASVLTGLFVAWLLGLALKLRPGQLGALVLVAGFGSSASLGYALIAQVFPDNGKAMLDAVVLNSIGSTIPVFVIGVPIAAHFGSREGGSGDSGAATLKALRSFFTSSLFAALVLGVAAAFVGLPDNAFTATLYQFLQTLQDAVPLMVALSIGLMLRPLALSEVGLALLLVALVKLALEPFLVADLASTEHIDGLGREVLLIEAAMPSGSIAALLAARYGCDAAFASGLAVVTYGLSLVTAPVAVYLLGR